MKNIIFAAILASLTLFSHSSLANNMPEISATNTQVVIQEPIDVNQATMEELVLLKGIGKKKAQAIIDYRLENGNFISIDDLTNVKGIGERFIENNRHLLKI
ncbi:ComEA family DNA-binding protein [Thalassotalea montiporae]